MRKTEDRVFARGRERHQGEGSVPTTRVLGGELLRLAEQVWWHGCFRREAPQSARVGKREAEEAAGRVDARERGHERGAAKKVVTAPARRKVMAWMLPARCYTPTL